MKNSLFRRLHCSISSLAVLLLLSFSMTCLAAPENKHVAITQIVEHPALDAVRKGVKDVLNEAGWSPESNLKWDYQSAQGSPATAAQIAKKFAGDQPDVLVAIATPSAQAAAASARNTNIVFSAVTDPVGAKLVNSWQKPGKNITGVSDLTPIKKHLELVKELVPAIKNLGVIYNPGEANSVTLIELVKQYAPELGLTVIESAAPKSADVQTAARALLGRVEALYVPTDNTVISAIEGIIKIAEQADIPVIAGDTDSVKRGAVAALGFNYYEVGRQTGNMVIQILNGAKPTDIPVQGVENTSLFANPKAAKRMGLNLSADFLAKVATLVE
jgi:putative tryptophan/tyrosine transport system substrate-binding protein